MVRPRLEVEVIDWTGRCGLGVGQGEESSQLTMTSSIHTHTLPQPDRTMFTHMYVPGHTPHTQAQHCWLHTYVASTTNCQAPSCRSSTECATAPPFTQPRPSPSPALHLALPFTQPALHLAPPFTQPRPSPSPTLHLALPFTQPRPSPARQVLALDGPRTLAAHSVEIGNLPGF